MQLLQIDQKVYATIATKYLFPLIVLLLTYFAPTFHWILAIGFFIGSDMCLRILLCLHKGEPVISSKMWRTVYKFLVGLILILISYVSQRMFAPDIAFMKITGSFLILVELKSIDEKAKEATGYSIFGLIVDKLIPKKNG